ncbi:type II secretion system F family protein, partial [Candidatus Woesearchaeota archaeon]|nr:type II secretion system F family protein [Candidatus Woesearchaeota archaeon]
MKLDDYLDKAGIHVEVPFLKLLLFRFAIFLNLAMSGYVIYRISQFVEYTLTYVIIVMTILWTLAFIGLMIIVWFLFLLILEFKILKRTEDIEDHLPEYLMATATNIRAGMDLEQAMWSSIKPKYGVLSDEIEIVAKKIMGGKDLNTALKELKNKYKSDLLKRSIDLIIEGKESGGQIAHLLTDLGENVQQIQNIRKEVASSVTAYIIFIGFSTILAAPFLFGISEQLIT